MHGRILVLAGVVAMTVAAPASALDTPGAVPLQAPVPTVQVPVPVPTVPVPVPTVRVPVPTAVPSVPAPAPTVRVPLPLPLPTAAAPRVGSSAASSAGASSGPTSSFGGGGSSAGGAAASGGGSSGGGAAASGGGLSGGGGAAAGSPGARGAASAAGSSPISSGPSQRGPGGAARPATRAQRIGSRERRLRDAVNSRRACLGELSRPERRVLVLRAGVGPPPPMTRARVARRLDMTVRRVARLETAGLRGCATSAGPGPPAP